MRAAPLAVIAPVVEDAADLTLYHVALGEVSPQVRTIGAGHMSQPMLVAKDNDPSVEEVEPPDEMAGRRAGKADRETGLREDATFTIERTSLSDGRSPKPAQRQASQK